MANGLRSPRVVELRGAAYDRGRAQAELCAERATEVTLAVTLRLAELGPALAHPKVVAWLDAQHAYTRDHDPDAFVEVQGIAEGFGIAADALFAWLYADVITDLAGVPSQADSASVWATPQGRSGAGAGGTGPFLVKNRDVRGTLGALQCVFRHDDPEWRGERILCVGTLGLPGAVSSGINTRGLAVADAPVGTNDHGEGWLRSLLMTRLLRECATVAEAIALVFRVPHAGGGALLLGDASGAVAAIDLAHGRVGAEEPEDASYVARCGHFVTERLRGHEAAADDAEARASHARLATLEHGLRDLPRPFAQEAIRTLMSRHGDSASAALCRHDERHDVTTASCAIHDCRAPALHISLGPPCTGPWLTIEP